MKNRGLSGKTVLVAGGAGFVGSTLVRVLLDLGANVWSLDDYSVGIFENLPDSPALTTIEADATDLDSVLQLFRDVQFQHVYHCIGDTFVPEAYEVPERFFSRNVGSTLNLLTAAKSAPLLERFLYVSSTEVYGRVPGERADENCPLLPANTYAVSKLAADRLCHTYQIEHGVPVVIARIFNCYGPRATHEYVIPEIIRQLHLGTNLKLGNLEAERDFTFVEDTARGLIALALSAIPDGDVANVGSAKAISVRNLALRIAKIMGLDDISFELDPARLRRLDVDRFCSDSSKLESSTGWRPQVGLDEGLRQTIAWYRDNGMRWCWMDRK